MVKAPFNVNRFMDEDPDGPVDQWLVDIVIPPRPPPPYRVALIAFWFGPLPKWFDYFSRSVEYSKDKGVYGQSIIAIDMLSGDRFIGRD